MKHEGINILMRLIRQQSLDDMLPVEMDSKLLCVVVVSVKRICY